MLISGKTEILRILKAHKFFHGVQNSFSLKVGILKIVKNRLIQKRKVKLFF